MACNAPPLTVPDDPLRDRDRRYSVLEGKTSYLNIRHYLLAELTPISTKLHAYITNHTGPLKEGTSAGRG